MSLAARFQLSGAGFTRLSRFSRLSVARGPVPCERPRAPKTVVRERLIPNGAWRGEPFLARSAGACPPRSFDLRENRTPTNAVFPTEARRGTGPRPTVKGGGLAYRRAGACPPRSLDLREKRTPTKALPSILFSAPPTRFALIRCQQL